MRTSAFIFVCLFLTVLVVAIIAVPFSANGQEFFPSEFQVAPGYQLSPAVGGQGDVAIAWGNTNYMLAWTDGRDSSYGLHMFSWVSDVFGTRVTSTGTVLDSAGLPINMSFSEQFEVALAWNGTHYLAAWSDGRGGHLTEDLYCTLVTEDGVPAEPNGVLVCGADGAQVQSAVGWDGSTFLVVWSDSRDPASPHIYAARIASDGTVLDPGGVLVSQATGTQLYPALAWDGANYLIAWEHILSPADDLYGCLFDPLDPSGSQPFPICAQPGTQVLAAATWNGVDFLVGWNDTRAGNIDIYAGRVTSGGVPLDLAGLPVATSMDDELFPALVSDDTTGQSLMAYQLRYDDALPDVMGTFIGSDGSVGSSFPVSAGNIFDEKKPAVGFNGSEFLVGWEDNRAGEFQSDVYATRLTKSGTVMDPCGILVTTATPYRQSATADYDGNQYLITWTEYNPEPDIACARVASDGTIVDSNAIMVSDLPTWERCPYVVSTPAKSLYPTFQPGNDARTLCQRRPSPLLSGRMTEITPRPEPTSIVPGCIRPVQSRLKTENLYAPTATTRSDHRRLGMVRMPSSSSSRSPFPERVQTSGG